MKSLLISLIMVAGFSAQAGLLSLTPGNLQLKNVVLNKSAQMTGSQTTMSLIGAGVRSKTVLFIPTDVYVTEVFASEPSKFSRSATDALKSLEASSMVAIRMTFLRNVDAPTVATSYKDALIANNVSLKDPAIATFLNNVAKGGDAEQGKSLVILMYFDANGGTSLFYEDTKGQQTSLGGNRSLQQQILSIWFGNSADSGLKDLKSALLKPVY